MKMNRSRLHKYLSDNLEKLTKNDYTKAEMQRNIESFGVFVDGEKTVKRLEWINDWELVDIQHWPERKKGDLSQIKVIEENNDFLVLFKPFNVVVAPGAGHLKDNVVQWLIENYPEQGKMLEEGKAEYALWKINKAKNEPVVELETPEIEQDPEFSNGLELTPKMWERNKDYRNNYFKLQKRERTDRREVEKEEEKIQKLATPHLSNAWFSAGLVHRIDKETQGLLLVAKSRTALDFYQDQFRSREVKKKYLAVVSGVVTKQVEVHNWQCRDKSNPLRQKLFWTEAEALHYDQQSRYAHSIITPVLTCRQTCQTLVEVEIFTGRMHQIRVQCESLGFALVADKIYQKGKKENMPPAFVGQEIEVKEVDEPSFSALKKDIFGNFEFCLLSNYLQFKNPNGELATITLHSLT